MNRVLVLLIIGFLALVVGVVLMAPDTEQQLAQYGCHGASCSGTAAPAYGCGGAASSCSGSAGCAGRAPSGCSGSGGRSVRGLLRRLPVLRRL